MALVEVMVRTTGIHKVGQVNLERVPVVGDYIQAPTGFLRVISTVFTPNAPVDASVLTEKESDAIPDWMQEQA